MKPRIDRLASPIDDSKNIITLFEIKKPKFLKGPEFTYEIVLDWKEAGTLRILLAGALGFCLGQFPVQVMDALPYLALLAFIKESRQAMLLDERLVYAFSGVKP